VALLANASKTRFAALALGFALTAALPGTAAHATILDSAASCGDPGSLQCRLDNILNLLDGLSIILGVVLLVIVVIAVRIYLKNRNAKKLLP
jgi:hypothetical protein